MGTITDVIRLTRIIAWINEEFLIFALIAMFYNLIVSGSITTTYFLFLGYLLFFLSFGFGFNSLIDHKKDFSIGKKHLYPFHWSRNKVILFLIFLFSGVLMFSFFLHAVFFAFLNLLFAIAYSVFKEKAIFSVILATLAQFALPFLVLTGVKITSLGVLIFIWLFLYGIVDLFIHQIDDYDTDLIAFRGVFAVKYGREKTRTLIYLFIASEFILSAILFAISSIHLLLVLFLVIFTAGQIKDIVLYDVQSKKKGKKSISLKIGDEIGFKDRIKRRVNIISGYSDRIIFSGHEPFFSAGFLDAVKFSKDLEIELMTTGRPFAEKQNFNKAKGIKNFLVHLSKFPDAEQVKGIRNIEKYNLSFYVILDKPDMQLIDYLQQFDYKALHLRINYKLRKTDQTMFSKYKKIKIKS